MKSDATKQARVAKNEGSFCLVKHEVIVLFGAEDRWFDPQLARHPEMKADPIATREFEEHLLSPRFGAEKTCARNFTNEQARIRAPKDSFPNVKLNSNDLLSDSGIPLSAIIFHLGQLWHSG